MPAIGTCGSGRTNIFTGMTTAQKQAALTQLQTAYVELASGNKGESYNYTQGDGGKGVTFTRANIAFMTQAIAELQADLGLTRRSRRPIKFWFGPLGGRGRYGW